MSRAFRYFFSKLFQPLATEYPLQIVGISSCCHLGYTLGTKKETDIVVAQKYTFDTGGFTNFMLVDTNGNHYNVNNSIWFFKWDSLEDWSKIEINDNLQVKVYGWRMPFLGTFPNIVSTIKSKNI
jgi:hypothetical protein